MGPHLSTPEVGKNKEITFTLQGKLHRVSVVLEGNGMQTTTSQNITPLTSLLTYLRDVALLRDTKYMCKEGGCGACIVSATFTNPHTNRKVTRAVNSCLVPILACHNWEINTCHGIGNKDIKYNPIQQALAQHNGTQCGYCSPGMVMSMFALTESRDVLTMQEVEDSFGGNLCRCTGYRPIMDAFKSLADDADPSLRSKFPDIEDLKICKKTNKLCEGECKNVEIALPFCLELEDEMHWYKVYTIQNILDIFQHIGNATYMLVAGNTAQGVYKPDPVKYYVDIRDVKELVTYKIHNDLILGANMTLTDTMDLMQKLSEQNNKFWFLKDMYNHLDLVAHPAVRNIGTLAGNLTIKHDHHEFPSDIFLLLETVGAHITIVRENGKEVTKTVAEFINFDMKKCVMKNITIPSFEKDTHLFKTYKIMPRAQNAHAMINAGFLIEYKNEKVTSARIAYGGINPNFIHATHAEKYLIGKNIFDDDVLQGVLEKLSDELKPNHVLPDPGPEFRKNLARNLYYKFFLATAPKDKINPKYQSGGQQLEKKLLSGVQLFQTNEKMFPVTKPVNKIEALLQSSGEALYIDDMPPIPGEVFGAFVLAEAVPFTKVQVDASEALKIPGVHAFVDYKDIPGKNLFTTSLLNPSEELLFCKDVVQYNGQPLGVIVADTIELAVAAGGKVKVEYTKPSEKAEYTIQSVLKDKKMDRIIDISKLEPERKGNNTKFTLKGSMTLIGQYHMTMETQRCICIPTEDAGYDIYSSTQSMDHVQMAAAQVLNIHMSKINVFVRRLGGGYGAKIFRASLISTAAVVACHKVRKPIRVILTLEANMKSIGKRFPSYAEYEVEVDENGVIQHLDSTVYEASGTSGMNEQMVTYIPHYMSSAYDVDTWKIQCNLVQTDMAGNAYCRAPGASEAIALTENIMDHISSVTGKTPLEVRRNNFNVKTEVKQVLDSLVSWSEYDKRLEDVKQFNDTNRWMKKGLSVSVMDYFMVLAYPYSAFVAIYAGDGTVAISHGGIECGQGINTKVVQVCAYELNIPMDTISVKPSNSLTAPNNLMTGGSITSEGVCGATIKACQELLRRLEPIRQKMTNPTWQELILEAKQFDIELCATGLFISNTFDDYLIPAACLSEVQVDLLTGEHVVQRVDLLEDVGQSISPAIDAGQIEGAFIMGLGNYTCEDLVYGDEGELVTHNTWTYKIPTVKDTPQDFRIMFKRDSSNPHGVLNSKATGEPALCLSIGVPFALRDAITSGKRDAKPDDSSFITIDDFGMQKRHKTTTKQPGEVMAWMLVHPQIHNTFASLGVQHGDAYRVSEDCLAILGDILSKLSVEDRSLRTFRRAIGFGQHIRKDLLPLLIHVKDDTKTKDATKIIDATIKILVNLTIPVECLLSMDVQSKTDVGRHTIFEINKLLYSSKEAFVDSRSIKAVTDHMKFVIERGAIEIEQCDSINNCLLLLRNILHIPEHRMQISNCSLTHSSMQNRILWNLFTQSIDKLLLHLMMFPQKIYWVVTMVQLIALMYKDQHVGTLQKLLSSWFEASLSDSSDDNESNTSPQPPNEASGDSSPMLTSDPTTSDSSDNNATSGNVKQHIVRSTQNRNKVLLTSHKQRVDDSSSSSSSNIQELVNKKDEQRACSGSNIYNSLKAQKRKFTNHRNEPLSTGSSSTTSLNPSEASSHISKTKDTKIMQSELSDYGYGTQVENQESISTSSNDDESPQQKPVHQKPHMVQKPRNKTRSASPQDKKELRRKKLIKRSKINIINIKGLLHHSPTDEDVSNILKEFTVDFLLKGYGSLVNELYTQLLSDTKVQIDTSHIFWLVTYFLKFATQLELEFEHIESVLSFNILAYLTYEGVHLCEQLEINSKETSADIKPCLRRMHLVVTAIKEFLQAIETYKRIPHLSTDHQNKLTNLQIQIASTDNLKCLLLMLIRQYNPQIQSRQYLQDLIITNHVLLLFLDNVYKMTEYPGDTNMVEHLKHFSNVEVMQQYGLLLEDFENNGKFINDCVFTMMHHIGGDIDNVSTLFQPNILKTFSKIWESDYEMCDDWSDLIEYVIHKFINVPSQPNSSTKIQEESSEPIEECALLSPKEENEWREEEIDSLYWYYIQSKKCDNVIANIERLYIENNCRKSRESIIHHLLEQNMISQSCYEQYMKAENINIDKCSPIIHDDQDRRDIQALKEQLVRENKGNAILWLQKLLLEACNCKVIINKENSSQDVYEPIPFCFIKLKQSIPIVPWYKQHSTVLKNKSFISLIHKLGFHLPSDTRKVFVRIPHFWSAAYTYTIAEKLGPIDPASLKFDVSLLTSEETIFTPTTDQEPQHLKNLPRAGQEVPSSSAGQSQHLLPTPTSTWFHAVLQSKLSNILDFANNAQTKSSSERYQEVPESLVESPEHQEAASEHNSICDTASVTSDLTRMYVSDEEDKQ